MVNEQFVRTFSHIVLSPDPDLAVAALMIARVEYARLEAGPYLDHLDRLGWEAKVRVESAEGTPDAADRAFDPDAYARVKALNDYLFGVERFVGNNTRYEDPRNSFLNDVIDRRTGIPITLALIYMEVARRAGLHVEGVNFPGHFLVRVPLPAGSPYEEDLIVDAFNGGAVLSREMCRALLSRHANDETNDRQPDADIFRLATKPQILARMLLNLKRLYVRMHSFPQARLVTDLLLATGASAPLELRDRGLLAYHLRDFASALRDLEAYLKLAGSPAIDDDERSEHEQIWEHVKTLRRRVASLN